MPRLLSIDEAAAKLGIPPGSLRTAARRHGLLVKMGRAVRIDPDDLPELIDRCRDRPRDRDSTAAPIAGTTSFETETDSCALAHETAQRLKTALARYLAEKGRQSGPRAPHQMTVATALDIYGTERAPAVRAPERIGYAIAALLPILGSPAGREHHG